MGRLAFVCSANVCRSPLMDFTFSEAIEGRTDQPWGVASRGTSVNGSGQICALVASAIAANPAGHAFAHNHRSHQVTAEFAAEQHLLLVATRGERAALASLNPATRARTFTLREAIWLGENKPSTAEVDRASGLVSEAGADPLQGYADLLHRRRGLLDHPKPSRPSITSGGKRRDPLDIPDGHGVASQAHTATLQQVQQHTRTFAVQVLGFLGSLR